MKEGSEGGGDVLGGAPGPAGSVQVLSTQEARLQLRSQPQVRGQGPYTGQACTGH